MLEYYRIAVSEGNDVKKNSGSHKCIIYDYWCFLEINFRFQPKVCNSCHDLMQKATSLDNIAIVSVIGNEYIIHF